MCFTEKKIDIRYFFFFQCSYLFGFIVFLYELVADGADHRLSLRSISLRLHYARFMILPSIVSLSFSRTFAFISHHPQDRYYPSLFPRECRSHLENAISEKPSSFSNFYFLILIIVWLPSSRVSSSFSQWKWHQGFPQMTVENRNERESQENCSLNNRGSS